MPVTDLVIASLSRAQRLTDTRTKLEFALPEAREELKQARRAMDDWTERVRTLALQIEKMARDYSANVAESAAAYEEAAEVAARTGDPVGPLLELTAADVHLRIEATDRARQDVFTVTVVTVDDRPVSGVRLEVRAPDRESTLRTTDEHGQASFSLQRGASRLRLLRHGVWELQLARLY